MSYIKQNGNTCFEFYVNKQKNIWLPRLKHIKDFITTMMKNLICSILCIVIWLISCVQVPFMLLLSKISGNEMILYAGESFNIFNKSYLMIVNWTFNRQGININK